MWKLECCYFGWTLCKAGGETATRLKRDLTRLESDLVTFGTCLIRDPGFQGNNSPAPLSKLFTDRTSGPPTALLTYGNLTNAPRPDAKVLQIV